MHISLLQWEDVRFQEWYKKWKKESNETLSFKENISINGKARIQERTLQMTLHCKQL